MKHTVLSLVSGIAASAALLLGSRPVLAADFAKAGNVSVAIERTFGIHFASATVDPDGDGPIGSDSDSATAIGFGWYAPVTPIHSARAALDVFVIDRLSIGGSLAFFTQTGDNGLDGVLFSPRVGYTFELSKLVTFWPRGGLTYMKIEDSSLFGLTLEPMFVLWPRPNWGVLLGPTLDFEFIGSNGGDSERSEFSIGIPSVGLIASF
jgi:hypothetical protein